MKTTFDITQNSQTQQNGTIRPVHPAIEDYVFKLLAVHDEPVLLEMEALAREQNFPIVGRSAGSFLEVLAKSIGAERVFEFGSGYGYSAYWFGRALYGKGQVICTDGDEKNIQRGRDFFGRLPWQSAVEFHHGWAQDIFKKIQGQFDIIYNDVDKIDYPEVWALAKDRLRPGGLYICDNVLWSGRVTQEKVTQDIYPGWTEAIQKHNLLISQDRHFDFFFNPTRDGLLVARRRV